MPIRHIKPKATRGAKATAEARRVNGTGTDQHSTRGSGVRRTRPNWWGQEAVLARLQDGEYVGDICRLASEEMDRLESPISVRTLRADISTWSESASWGEQFQKALKLWYNDNHGALLLSKSWHDEFFMAMEARSGKAEDACVSCGVGYGIVLSLMDRRNKCYDKIFHERFRVAEAERIGVIRGQYLQYAEDPQNDERTRLKVQQTVLETHAPTLHGSSKEIHVSGSVDHSHTHGLDSGLAQEVVMASMARTRALHHGRQGALNAVPERDSDRVIDITPVRERVDI